jgi:hypothetical protein
MLQIWRQQGMLRIGSERNLLVASWQGSPIGDEIQTLADAAERLALAYPKGSAMLHVVTGRRPKFDDRMREDGVTVIRNPSNFPLGVGHLILIDGLAGATTRAFLSTIMLIGRSNRPRKVFGDPSECAPWLAQQLSRGPEPWTAQEVLATHVAMLAHTDANTSSLI